MSFQGKRVCSVPDGVQDFAAMAFEQRDIALAKSYDSRFETETEEAGTVVPCQYCHREGRRQEPGYCRKHLKCLEY